MQILGMHGNQRARELRSLRDDLLYAVRSLSRHPVFTGFTISVIAGGISVSVSTASLLDRLVIRAPAGIIDQSSLVRVVAIEMSSDSASGRRSMLTGEEYYKLRDYLKSPLQVLSFTPSEAVTVSVGTGPIPAKASLVSPEFFADLGVKSAEGTLSFGTQDVNGLPPHVVFSTRFWSINNRDSCAGHLVRISGRPFRCLGIAGDEFHGLDLRGSDMWLAQNRGAGAMRDSLEAIRRDTYAYQVIARIPRGMNRDSLASEIAGSLGIPVMFVSLRSARWTGSRSSSFAGLIALVSLLVMMLSLLVATNLLSMRSLKRENEYAIWSSLGAPPERVIRIVVLEIIAIFCVVTVLCAWGIPIVEEAFRIHIAPELYVPERWWDGRSVALFLGVLAATLATSLLRPVRAALLTNSSGSLAQLSSSVSSFTATSSRRLVVGAQVTLSFLLIAAAGLFIQSFRRASGNASGINYTGMYYATLSIDSGTNPNNSTAIVSKVLKDIESVSGVTGAAFSGSLPFMLQSMVLLRLPDHRPFPTSTRGGPYLNVVTPNYLRVMGTDVVRGRALSNADTLGSLPVAVINTAMADEVWPGKDAIGKCFSVLLPPIRCFHVVGVAHDSHTIDVRRPGAMQFYLPLAQVAASQTKLFLLVRVRQDAHAALGDVTKTLETSQSVNPSGLRSLSDLIEPDMGPLRVAVRVLSAVGIFALLFALTSIYGVVNYSIWARRREFGIRMSLGSSPTPLLVHVLADYAKIVGVALLAGTAAASFAFPLARPLLVSTSPYDPISFGLAFLSVLLSTFSASLCGAWVYLRLEPARLLTMK